MLLVFAYMNGIYSSREIEKACRNDIRFMWILQNSPVPDHTTIAHFQNERLSAVMENLFYQLVLKLSELGEAEFKNVFVDSTKMEANAVQKNMNRLYDRSTGEWLGRLERSLDYEIWYCGHYHIDKQLDKVYMMYNEIRPLHDVTPKS